MSEVSVPCGITGLIFYHKVGYIEYIWRIARKRNKLQLVDINLAVTGSRGTIATSSPGVYAVGAILADLILAV